MIARISAFILVAVLAAVSAAAAPLPKGSGPVVLRVTGAIENTNAEGAAEFDLAMLEDLAGRTTTTRTPWFDGPRAFSGPLMSAVLDAVGATGATIRLVAINDYAADVPVADVEAHPVILATRIDGAPMSVRDKGPTFLVYPFDEAPELYNELYFGRSVWQVVRIDVF